MFLRFTSLASSALSSCRPMQVIIGRIYSILHYHGIYNGICLSWSFQLFLRVTSLESSNLSSCSTRRMVIGRSSSRLHAHGIYHVIYWGDRYEMDTLNHLLWKLTIGSIFMPVLTITDSYSITRLCIPSFTPSTMTDIATE